MRELSKEGRVQKQRTGCVVDLVLLVSAEETTRECLLWKLVRGLDTSGIQHLRGKERKVLDVLKVEESQVRRTAARMLAVTGALGALHLLLMVESAAS